MQKKCPLYRDVRFIEIFSKVVWPQSEAIRSSSYCPSYGGVRFIVCPLYRDSTLSRKLIPQKYLKVPICKNLSREISGNVAFAKINP